MAINIKAISGTVNLMAKECWNWKEEISIVGSLLMVWPLDRENSSIGMAVFIRGLLRTILDMAWES